MSSQTAGFALFTPCSGILRRFGDSVPLFYDQIRDKTFRNRKICEQGMARYILLFAIISSCKNLVKCLSRFFHLKFENFRKINKFHLSNRFVRLKKRDANVSSSEFFRDERKKRLFPRPKQPFRNRNKPPKCRPTKIYTD